MSVRWGSFPSRSALTLVALASLAPTVGDIGSCNADASPLDAQRFFDARAAAVCDRCGACSLRALACRRACDVNIVALTTFPRGCAPAVHDGEVCIRAIQALSCGGATDLTSDAPIAPTECDFCPAADQGKTP